MAAKANPKAKLRNRETEGQFLRIIIFGDLKIPLLWLTSGEKSIHLWLKSSTGTQIRSCLCSLEGAPALERRLLVGFFPEGGQSALRRVAIPHKKLLSRKKLRALL
jgi:hypothetical protein